MLPWKMLLTLFAVMCFAAAVGYHTLAGYGALYEPSDFIRHLVTSLFGSCGLTALYVIAYIRRTERDVRITLSHSSGDVDSWLQQWKQHPSSNKRF